MDPLDQVRVVGTVEAAVTRTALNGIVDGADSTNGSCGVVLGTKCGGPDEVGRASEATEWVLAISRMLRNAGHREGMQHLQQE